MFQFNNKKVDNYSKRILKKEEHKSNTQYCKPNTWIKEKPNQDKIKFLIEGLNDENGLVRRHHAEALAQIGADALPELINALLNSKSVIQRRAAAKTLKLVGDPAALPQLIKALTNDSDSVVQFSAAGAIAIFGEAAVNHLIIVLESKQHTEMQYGLAAWCLEFIGAKAPNAIKIAAQSTNKNVRAAAISALEEHVRKTQDKEAIQLIKCAINDTAENVQIEAIKLVGKLSVIESFIPILISKLKAKSQEIRKATVFSLMQLNIHEAISPLKDILQIEQDKNVKTIVKLAIKNLIANKT